MVLDVLVNVGTIDFMVIDMEEDYKVPLIGRLFLATSRALIDMKSSELALRLNDEEIKFSTFIT